MKNKKGFKICDFIMKTISWCVMAILLLILSFLVLYIVINKSAQAKGQNSPLGLYTIISPSMTPKIGVYDVVFVAYKDPKEIEVGDVVSYYSSKKAIFGTTPITHRVVEKFDTNEGITFRTKGDANAVMDDEIIQADSVIGTVRFIIPKLGRIQFFLASKAGWIMIILIPALAIVAYDIVKLGKLIKVKEKIDYANKLENESTEIKTETKKRTRKTSKK